MPLEQKPGNIWPSVEKTGKNHKIPGESAKNSVAFLVIMQRLLAQKWKRTKARFLISCAFCIKRRRIGWAKCLVCIGYYNVAGITDQKSGLGYH